MFLGKKRSTKLLFFALFFWSKMCILCMFYVDLELDVWKKLWVEIFLNKNLLGIKGRVTGNKQLF